MVKSIGVDIGGTNIRAGLISNGRIINSVTVSTQKKKSKELFNCVVSCIRKVWDDNIEYIGIGCPGPLDYKLGKVLKTPNLPFHNYDLKNRLEIEFRKTVFLDNDANCFSYAQFTKYEVSSLFGITLGTGVGSGFVLDGAIYHGRLFASEIGKIPFEEGILEDYLSESALVSVSLKNGIKVKSTHELFLLCMDGSKKAIKVFEGYGRNLGKAISIIHAVLDPEVVVIGGGISNAWRFFSKSMEKELSKRCIFRKPKVVKSMIKDAGILGAGMLGE